MHNTGSRSIRPWQGHFCFLGFHRLVTRVASEISGRKELLLYGDYPPADARTTTVRTIYNQFGFTELPDLTSFCIESINTMELGLVNVVRTKLARIRDRFKRAR
jgi:hypothetical protein